ncbi:hypothetical protein B6D60_10045 [candidate division KSB1 bacterium 4484_87]|nr:MAG: hypothetical protein B6D60_10045 [candidate division KSB1 bacterium 4484_87]
MSPLKKCCRKYTKFFLTLLSLSLLTPDAGGAEQSWKRLTDANFQIVYQKKDAKNAVSLLATLTSVAPDISQKLGAALPDTITVIIAPTEKVYRQFAGSAFPDWSQGLASPGQNLILMKSPRFLHLSRGYDKIAVHELTHIVLNRAVGNQGIPRWLNEGIAVYFSKEKAFASNSMVSKALLTKSIIPLEEIDRVLLFNNEKAQLAYQESYLAVRFLFEHFGAEKVKEILRRISSGEETDQAFAGAIGMDFAQFERTWLAKISETHRWQFLVDFDTYLWIFVLLLFLLGFVLVRRRNRLKIKQWEEDEFDDFDTV